MSANGAGVGDIVRRIWGRDYSLWPEASPGGGGDWLGWLDLPKKVASDRDFADWDHLEAFRGATSFNVLGMGGSSLTAEVLSSLFPDSDPVLNVFDSVNPVTISDALESMDIASAVFAVASKSGSTVEPLSLEGIFRSALNDAGVSSGSEHFCALTDAGTVLADRASAGEFEFHVSTPANVGGRFSALSEFGMCPASVCGMPVKDIGRSALEMANECRSEGLDNPGLELGLFLAGNALRGRDKVTFSLSPGLERFGLWLEQLLAESTGKNGRGLVPVAGEPVLPRESYSADRQFVCIALEGEDVAENPAFRDHPTYRITLPDRASIGGEFFRWEFATSVAACGIGVYPFDQPDVESAKEFAREALGESSTESLASESLGNAVDSVIRDGKERDYVAIVAYLPESEELTRSVSGLRRAISCATGLATTFGYGPRYLHSTGQLHKGGPDGVHLLVLTQESGVDVDVPGAAYSLGELSSSQAIGDVLACRSTGRHAEMLRIEGDAILEIDSVVGAISAM